MKRISASLMLGALLALPLEAVSQTNDELTAQVRAAEVAFARTMEMRDFEFFPAKVPVDAGTEVTWVNRDSAPHNAVADAFDSGTLNGGDSWSVALDQPGTYSYVCTFHPGMGATLTVR